MALLVLGGIALVVGIAGFLMASAANRSNDKTYAEEAAILDGADPVAAADALIAPTAKVETAVRAFRTAAQETARYQRRTVDALDRAVDLADSGDRAGARAAVERRVQPLIRKFDGAVDREIAAWRELDRALKELEEVLA